MLVTCPKCQKTLKVPDTVAGKKIRCPSCSGVVDVPLQSGGPAAPKTGSPTADAGTPIRKARSVGSESTASLSAPVKAKPTAASSPVKQPPSKSAPPRSADAGGDTRRSTTSGSSGGKSSSRSSPPSRPKKRTDRQSESLFEDDTLSYDDAEQDPYDPYGSYESNPFAAPRERSSTRSSRSGGSASDASGKRIAGAGLLMQGWAIVSCLVMILCVIALAFIMGAGSRGGPPPAAFTAISGLFSIAQFIAGLVILVGQCLCLAIPKRSGARGLVIASISALALQVLLIIAMIVVVPGAIASTAQGASMVQFLAGSVLVFFILIAIAGLTQAVCFELFLRSASLYVGRDDLAKQALIVLVGIPAGFVLYFVFVLLGAVLGNAVHPVAGMLMLIPIFACGIAMIVFAVMHVALLFRLGFALRE